MIELVQEADRLGPGDDRVIEAVLSESWEYADAQTQLLTHNIHRYSGKFIPQVALRAVTILARPGELVLDPYCGSGTTLIESALSSRRAIGIDMSPLAVLIARTKVTPVPTAILSVLLREMEMKLTSRGRDEDTPLFAPSKDEACSHVPSDMRMRDEWFCKWFQPKILEDLIIIDHAICEQEDPRTRDIARVAFSDILRRSSNAHSGYPNVMLDKKAPQRMRPIKPFLKALTRVCGMVASLGEANARWEDVRAIEGNARSLPVGDCSVDAVVSHPPYIGSSPYAEYGALSLKWLGTDPNELDRRLTGGRRQSADVVERFRENYAGMLRETSRVLRPDRYAFLMVGNPVVRGETIDLAAMTIDLAQSAGLQLVVRTRRTGVNRRANKMGAEHLLFFRKPDSLRQYRPALHRVRLSRASKI
jgi:SAM-dependent methyltransferase